jgi:CHASE2 domain-containing sensor protein
LLKLRTSKRILCQTQTVADCAYPKLLAAIAQLETGCAKRLDIMNNGQFPHSSPGAKAKTSRSQQNDTAASKSRWQKWGNWGQVLVGGWAIAAAAATGLNLGIVQLLERQAQTFLFETRGTVTPPADVVILAIDETSLAQGEIYRMEPDRYPYFEPIQTWAWQRTAYATAIDRLMAAGAQAVALDIIFAAPSSYGDADDQRFAQTLQQHPEAIVLASQYAEVETLQGFQTQLDTPLPRFCASATCTGFINFLIEPDGRIHQQGDAFLRQLLQNAPPNQAAVMEQLPSFAKATLQAAQRSYPTPKGESIFFYGPAQTFEQIPFWYVLDPDTWQGYLQSGAYFKDKIVVIGSTAAVHQDFHPTPFSETWRHPIPMAGVEIHANAIATLLEGKSIAEAIPQAPLRGLVVLVGIGVAGWLFNRSRQPLHRLAGAMGFAILWLGVSYVLFVQARLIVPTAVPVGAIVLGGFSQLVIGSVQEQRHKRQLRNTLKQYVTSPIVQEIISQQEEFQDLLRERELALAGKILASRYRITRVLGSGGFSETYVAEDLQRPGHPSCVVKQLRVLSDNPNTFKLAQRLFQTEAETLERLGQHPQIPQLLASFEENQEFYLVQELVQGHPLSRELLPKRSRSEIQVIEMIHELLLILGFVHQQGVIHRDLKPSNVMRRHSDYKLVLIDFGVAKKITTQLIDSSGDSKFTVSIGTPGYMPSEQSAGRPQFNSDIYALGMIGIEALTGLSPNELQHDERTGAVLWFHQARWVSTDLAVILTKMVHHDFTRRYASVETVLADLVPLYNRLIATSGSAADVNNEAIDLPSAELPDLEDDFSNEVTVNLPDQWTEPGN